MKLARTERFKRAYQRLSQQENQQARKAIETLLRDFRYPSLHVKRIKGTAHIWEARVSRGCRMTFQIQGDMIVLRNIGEHPFGPADGQSAPASPPCDR